MNHHALHCEATDTKGSSVTVTAESQLPPLVAESSRTISGRVLPWDELGRTGQGALQFSKGSINVPTDITQVKLLAGHSPTGVPIGHATGWESKADGLYMTFQLGSSTAATDALTSARERVIDAFSIEAFAIERQGTKVEKSILSAVALVPMPAFASARVDTINASAPSGDENTPTPTPEPSKDDDMNPKLKPGTLPGDFTPTGSTTEVHASLDDVANYLCAAITGQETDTILAELKDITDAGMTSRTAPQWLGELWSGVTYTREIVPLMTQAPLRSRKAIGYRWKQKPGVDKYSGNKTEIPSKPATIEPVERDAQRWAGGNDLDRIFWDFKETEFLKAYWAAMAEDYAIQTDRDAANFLVTNATKVDGTAENLIHAVARGSIKMKNTLKSNAGWVLINSANFESILQMSMLDAPKFLDIIPAMDPSKWIVSDLVPANTAIIGTKAAATHFELPGSPLRVEAEHIAKGGRDAALFGYTALMLNRPEGLLSVTFDPASTTPTAPVTTEPAPTA